MSAYDIARGIGYLTIAEVDCIKDIVRRLPPGALCVNIGSGAGTSVIALLEERRDISVTDIDLDLSHGESQLRDENLIDAANLYRVQGDSKEIGASWSLPIDYLFVDGDHSEAGIRGDLAAWLPHVKVGGYVLIHDYAPYPASHALAGRLDWPAVPEVTNEVMKPYRILRDADRLRVFVMESMS